MINSFPKIFALGQSYVKSILDDPIEITEKVDGSQFAFGLIDDILHARSKGQEINILQPEKMFRKAIDYISSISHLLPNNHIFYCEYLNKEKHNVLNYSRIPKNNLALFAVYDKNEDKFLSERLDTFAELLGIENVPIFANGKHDNIKIDSTLDRKSFLGGCKIEGFVIKNYHRPFLLGGQPIPIMCAKYVSESFKEVHKKSWKTENTGKGKWETFKDNYRTEARWYKAIQHLRDSGELENSPRDIGKLLIEIKKDITEEEQEIIKEFLWREFGEELLRNSIRGFPEFYKRHLAESINQ